MIELTEFETGLMDVAKLFNLGYRWEENVRLNVECWRIMANERKV